MHLVIVHGYILQGTGSNIYVANVAKAWKKLNHSVTVICQDLQACNLKFVDEYFGPNDSIPKSQPKAGQIRVIVPNINNLLPVYVLDDYIKLQVKTVYSMSRDEIENHIKMTSSVLRTISETQQIDKILANHAILSPVIVKRALGDSNIPYDVKIHGSAIEFVLVHHKHLLKYAYEGMSNASKIIAGTEYITRRIKDIFSDKLDELKIIEKTVIIPPGMDPDLFELAENFQETKNNFYNALSSEINLTGDGRSQTENLRYKLNETGIDLHNSLVKLGKTYNQRSPDKDCLNKLTDLKEEEPIIIYFGKFLETKGVGELILNIPHILEKIPNSRFIFAGFGFYREHMESLLWALENDDIEYTKKLANAGKFISHKIDIDKIFKPISSMQKEKITITGFLNHSVLSKLLPLASVCIVPSKLSEAFGMVAVEAMASGVLPICNNHSGLHDVMKTVSENYKDIRNLLLTDKNNFFEKLPSSVTNAIEYLYPNGLYDYNFKKRVSQKLREISIKYYSWNKIATKLIMDK
ncbi:MAG TPA: glycosyltransferase family 4 protein [Victivallales bacterium]|nr:glycosyltransferase family 4 protein [Victivallales bacterium]